MHYEGDGITTMQVSFMASIWWRVPHVLYATADVLRLVTSIDEVAAVSQPIIRFNPIGVDVDLRGFCRVSLGCLRGFVEFWLRLTAWLTVYGYRD